jgi:hypothetical protein
MPNLHGKVMIRHLTVCTPLSKISGMILNVLFYSILAVLAGVSIIGMALLIGACVLIRS